MRCSSLDRRHADRDMDGFAAERGGNGGGGKGRVKSIVAHNLMFRSLRKTSPAVLMLVCVLLSGCNRIPTQNSGTTVQSAVRPTPATAALAPTAQLSNSTASEKAKTAPSRPSGPIQFTDVTAQAGIHFKHNTGAYGKKVLPETMGSGVCFLDYDNDGWQDILFVNSMDWPGHKSGKSFPALYHNNQDGTFTDVTRQAGLAVEMYGLGCAVGDYDNDGNEDIYITAVGTNHLFRNLGTASSPTSPRRRGLPSPGFSTSAVWFDYDNDGKLDLFVAHYMKWSIDADQYCSLTGKNKSYCTPQAYKGQSCDTVSQQGQRHV